MNITGADACSLAIRKTGAKHVFGSPGTSELPILDRILSDPKMTYFFTVHESICVGMADGFARASGTLGVANVHATQGTLNAMGYIRAANRDNSPVLIVAGAPARSYAINEPNHFAYGVTDMVRSISKWSWNVASVDEIPKSISRAATIATSQPKGPTYVSIPQDLLLDSLENTACEEVGPFLEIEYRGNETMISHAAQQLMTANNPLIFSGNQVGWNNAVDELVALAESLGAPVISEALDRGPMIHSVNFPGDHALFIGYFDSRDKVIRRFLAESDVLMVIGAKATYERVLGSLGDKKIIVQIDMNPREIAKNHKADIAIVGNLADTLSEVTAKVADHLDESKRRSFRQRFEQIKEVSSQIRRGRDLGHIQFNGGAITPMQLIKALKVALSDECIVVDDSQSFSYYLKKFYEFRRPKSMFGSMASHIGWGLPASLGIQLACPSRRIVCIVSDASLMFSIQALATASRYNIPVSVIVCNNQGFMSLKLELSRYLTKRQDDRSIDACDLSRAKFDIATLANGFGVYSETIEEARDLTKSIRVAMESDGPTLVNVLMTNQMESWCDSWYTPPEDRLKGN